MPKVVYNPAQGLVQQAGSGIQFSTFPYTTSTTTITTVANNTGSLPGLYVVTAGGQATVKMPTAASYPGGMFIFRNGDANATILTGSGETNGTKVFVQGNSAAASALNGSQLTLQNKTGASVALVSDGVNYIVVPGSGSITFGGT